MSNDTIAYTYDELSRVKTRSVDNVAVSLTYDALGRVTVVTNALGSFTNNYLGVTPRLDSVIYPNGQTTTFSYYSTNSDQRLQTERKGKGSGLKGVRAELVHEDIPIVIPDPFPITPTRPTPAGCGR